MTHMKRSSWISRDKLNQQRSTRAPLAAAKTGAFVQCPGHRGGSHGGGHSQVDKAGPSNLYPGHQGRCQRILIQGQNQRLRHFSRGAPERLGQLQGDAAGQIAMTGLFGSLERDRRRRKPRLRRKRRDGGRQSGGNLQSVLG